jgi:glucokinase
MWSLLADAPAGAILESYWPVEVRRFVIDGLLGAGNPAALEVWCDVSVETARRRFEQRHPRHAIHGDLLTDAEWERCRVSAQPLGLGPLLRFDTAVTVDIDAVATWVRAQSPKTIPSSRGVG